MYYNENNSIIYKKKKEKFKFEFVFSGEIHKYSEKKKKFIKKKCGITNSEFILHQVKSNQWQK